MNRNQHDASFLLFTCSPVLLSRPKAVRGPDCLRAANPRRCICCSNNIHESKSARRTKPRMAMRGPHFRSGATPRRCICFSNNIMNRNQQDASFLLFTCSPVLLSRPKAVRGPDDLRAANPRRCICCLNNTHESKSARRTKPRMAMRGPHFRSGATPRRCICFSFDNHDANRTANGEDSLRDSSQVPALPCGASCVLLIGLLDVIREVSQLGKNLYRICLTRKISAVGSK